jgi:ABC-2 type transport system ATP-binding protein
MSLRSTGTPSRSGRASPGLVGANGAGKSTLIKILLRLLPPTKGLARVLGLDAQRDGEQIRALVGYMPEHDCLPSDTRWRWPTRWPTTRR